MVALKLTRRLTAENKGHISVAELAVPGVTHFSEVGGVGFDDGLGRYGDRKSACRHTLVIQTRADKRDILEDNGTGRACAGLIAELLLRYDVRIYAEIALDMNGCGVCRRGVAPSRKMAVGLSASCRRRTVGKRVGRVHDVKNNVVALAVAVAVDGLEDRVDAACGIGGIFTVAGSAVHKEVYAVARRRGVIAEDRKDGRGKKRTGRACGIIFCRVIAGSLGPRACKDHASRFVRRILLLEDRVSVFGINCDKVVFVVAFLIRKGNGLTLGEKRLFHCKGRPVVNRLKGRAGKLSVARIVKDRGPAALRDGSAERPEIAALTLCLTRRENHGFFAVYIDIVVVLRGCARNIARPVIKRDPAARDKARDVKGHIGVARGGLSDKRDRGLGRFGIGIGRFAAIVDYLEVDRAEYGGRVALLVFKILRGVLADGEILEGNRARRTDGIFPVVAVSGRTLGIDSDPVLVVLAVFVRKGYVLADRVLGLSDLKGGGTLRLSGNGKRSLRQNTVVRIVQNGKILARVDGSAERPARGVFHTLRVVAREGDACPVARVDHNVVNVTRAVRLVAFINGDPASGNRAGDVEGHVCVARGCGCGDLDRSVRRADIQRQCADKTQQHAKREKYG